MKKSLVIIFFCFLLLSSFQCSRENASETPKIYVIGLDGADWDIIDPLIKKGELNFFKKLKKESSWARLKTFKPTLSAIIWTSIATGKTMDKHGIGGWFYNKNGKKVPLSNADKKVPSIWEINDSFGNISTVVNWFVTAPPDKIKGIIVSDRFKVAMNQVLRNPDKFKSYINTVYPGKLYSRLYKILKEDFDAKNLRYAKIIQSTNIPDYVEQYKIRYNENFKEVVVLKSWKRFVFYDHITEKTTEYLLNVSEQNLFMTYFRMPDVFMHFGSLFLEEGYLNYINNKIKKEGEIITLEDKKEFEVKYSDVVCPILKHKEKIVEKIYNKAKKEDAYILILSDHGFTLDKKGYDHTGLSKTTPPPDGILMILGPDVAKKEIKASVYDIAPTILYLMNKPIGSKMDGKPLVNAFIFKKNIKYKEYIKKKQVQVESSPELDKKTIEELKSLGYIK